MKVRTWRKPFHDPSLTHFRSRTVGWRLPPLIKPYSQTYLLTIVQSEEGTKSYTISCIRAVILLGASDNKLRVHSDLRDIWLWFSFSISLCLLFLSWKGSELSSTDTWSFTGRDVLFAQMVSTRIISRYLESMCGRYPIQIKQTTQKQLRTNKAKSDANSSAPLSVECVFGPFATQLQTASFFLDIHASTEEVWISSLFLSF